MTNEERSALIAQGWTPPLEPVDPDRLEARTLAIYFGEERGNYTPARLALKALKRGRALAAAEAQPGMVWVKHDGSDVCPVSPDLLVLTKHASGFDNQGRADWFKWPYVTHYAIITQPEEK